MIYISAPEYDLIKVRGSGIVKCMKTLVSSDINLVLEGEGEITLTDIQTNNLMANLDGEGIMNIRGTTEDATFRINGAGTINTASFNAKSVDIGIKGSGVANVKVWNSLDVKIAGNGKVVYDGNPIVNEQLSGAAILAKR